MPFTNDAFYWYNVGDFAKLGLAVPNHGTKTHSQNSNIRYLTNVIGKNLQAVMFHQDASQTSPPSPNTIARIHKLCTRARDVMASRAVPENAFRMESSHANPSPEVHLVYPTPYFAVRNPWLKDYATLILTALTEAMQHQENANALEITEAFTGLIGQYIQRVYRLISVELLQIPMSEASKPDFTLTTAQLTEYRPSAYFTSTEMVDTMPNLADRPTENDIQVLVAGIPVTMLPNLPQWPSSVTSGGPAASGSTPAVGTGASFAPPPTI